MVDFLLSIVGLAALGGAIYEFVMFVGHGVWKWQGVIAIVLAVVFCACALLLFLRHVNKEEEIHITQ
jgi:membrane protein implicated in regulation of membrane protease activity